MPIHDWTKVDAGIFHHFHLNWLGELARALNSGILPPDFYALAEQRAGGVGPDVLTLQGPPADTADPGHDEGPDLGGGLAVATAPTKTLTSAPPKVQYRSRMPDVAWYALKADRLVVRHVSGDRVIAVVEVMSPGNKAGEAAFDDFLRKAWALLRAGVHLLVIDLFPPTSRDPHGIHDAIWEEGTVSVDRSPGQVLTCAAYKCGREPEAFVEPVGVGGPLPDGMPLFLTEHVYVPVPLNRTYDLAWAAVPAVYRRRLG